MPSSTTTQTTIQSKSRSLVLSKTKSRLPALLLVSIASLFSTACSIFGVQDVEEAPFALVTKDNKFELRDYESYVVVEAKVEASFRSAGTRAFRKLFKYISGENEGSQKIAMTAPVIAEAGDAKTGEKIAMTAPVIAEQDGEVWRYRFVLPEQFTIDNAPRPLNKELTLIEVPSQLVAVKRFSGISTESAQAKHTKALMEWVASQGLEMISEPRWAGYNGPITLPPLRRNEILIDVSK